MSFIFRRKKFKFHVAFEVEDLSLTPFVNGVLFVKIRLIGGGTFEQYTTREEVSNNRVQWNKKTQFDCRIYANNSTGELEACILRVSLRKESKGGKTYQKLGFADINLSEYAGAGHTSRRYLLEGYSSRTRLDNSMIKVNVNMKLLSGDPVFKVPVAKTIEMLGQEPCDGGLHAENKGAEDKSGSNESVASGSSGFGSLTRSKQAEEAKSKEARDSQMTPSKLTPKVIHEGSESSVISPDTFQGQVSLQCRGPGDVNNQGHNRNNSSTSEVSKVSGYHSLGPVCSHSRDSSCDNIHTSNHKRSCSADAAEPGKMSYLGTRKKLETDSSIEQRLGSTRLDAEMVIENLLKSTDFQEEDNVDKQGLELYIGPDGKTALSRHQLRENPGMFERVIIGKR